MGKNASAISMVRRQNEVKSELISLLPAGHREDSGDPNENFIRPNASAIRKTLTN